MIAPGVVRHGEVGRVAYINTQGNLYAVDFAPGAFDEGDFEHPMWWHPYPLDGLAPVEPPDDFLALWIEWELSR